MRLRWVALALTLACSACTPEATLPRPNQPIDTVVSRTLQAMPGERAQARVEQSGSKLHLGATWICDLHGMRTVDRAELHHVVNDAVTQPGWLTMTIGSLFGTAGIVTMSIALAKSEDHLARDLATGGVLTAVGAAVFTAGYLIYPNKAKDEVRRARVNVDEGVQRPNVPCQEVAPAARAAVTGRIAGPPALEIPFGDTDDRGALDIELADALPPTLYRDAAAGATLTLYLRDSKVGSARLDEVRDAVEEKAWPVGAAEACATTSADGPCGKIERHLRDFPAGRHEAEARAALTRAAAGLPARRRAEEAEKASTTKEAARRAEQARTERAAAEAAARGAAAACRKICATSCKGALPCITTCVESTCP